MGSTSKASNLVQKGDLVEAEKLCDEIINFDSGDAEAFHLKATIRLKNKDINAAVKNALTASELEPENINFRLTLAKAFAQKGDRERAISVLVNAVKQDDSNYACWLNLGLLCFDDRKFKDALASFQAAVSVYPERPEAYSGAALSLFQLNQKNIAIEQAKKALELNETRAVTLCLLGKYLAASKQPKIARFAFAKSVNLDPALVDSHAGLASSNAAIGNFNDAIRATDKLFQQFPLFSRRSKSEKRKVLVLESNYDGYVAGQTYGKNIFSQFNYPTGLPTNSVSYFHHHIDRQRPVAAALELGNFDLILNNVVNSERASYKPLKNAIEKIAAEMDLPIINSPEGVSETTRVDNYKRLSGAKNFIFPKTIELFIKKDNLKTIEGTILKETPLPIILRPIATHAGKGAKLIKSHKELLDAIKHFIGLRMYSIAYHNCTEDNEISRRYRLACIGGDLVPVNMHAAHDWNVHGDERTSENWQALNLDKDELSFLSNPSSVIGGEPNIIFDEIRMHTPLDVFGFDFALSQNKEIIVFEVNASMAFSTFRLLQNYPYLRQYKELNDQLIEDLIESKISHYKN